MARSSGVPFGLVEKHRLEYTRRAPPTRPGKRNEEAELPGTGPSQNGDRRLAVYFLPPTPWADVQQFQQRLVYEMGEPPRRRAALVLVEHPPIITIGRQGSRGQIQEETAEELEVRFVNRGGAAWLQTPGQISLYGVLPLDPPSFGIERLRNGLYETLIGGLEEFQIFAQRDESNGGIVVNGRQIAAVGAAVKGLVSCQGGVLNVALTKGRERVLQPHPSIAERKETCMLRERLLPVRPGTIRESLARRFAQAFGYHGYYLCPNPPIPKARSPRHVVAQ
jgi:lipoate-protein ligase B